jgi:NADPH-dependent curcumin reductase CurA
MSALTNSQWILRSRPQGRIKKTDFERHEKPIADLKDNEVLVKTLVLSFDPTQRGWAAMDTYLPAVGIGEVMRAFAIGQVVASKSKTFKVGSFVAGLIGWQEYLVFDATHKSAKEYHVIPSEIPLHLTVAFLLTGATAYFGLTDIGRLKKGETLVVSGAAGATGSIAGQLGKILGARVIGIAGGVEKCKWLMEEAHFDAVIDYKNEDVRKRIVELCPKGVDVFFDNVGGEILDAVLGNLARKARVVMCGAISGYDNLSREKSSNPTELAYGIKLLPALIISRASIEGFLLSDYISRISEPLMLLYKWTKEGKIVQAIDMQEGFENIPDTLVRLFEGKNLGKQLLKLSEPPIPVQKNVLTQLAFKALGTYYARKLQFTERTS